MMYYYDGGFPMHSFGFGLFGSFVTLVFWVAVLYGVYVLFKKHEQRAGVSRALPILKERYAKGELTKEQFEAMKKDVEE